MDRALHTYFAKSETAWNIEQDIKALKYNLTDDDFQLHGLFDQNKFDPIFNTQNSFFSFFGLPLQALSQ